MLDTFKESQMLNLARANTTNPSIVKKQDKPDKPACFIIHHRGVAVAVGGNPNLVKRLHNCTGPHLFMPCLSIFHT